NSEIEGYTFVAYLSTTEGTDEITEYAEETVEIKNVYETPDEPAVTGTLIITKSVDGANVTKEEAEGALTFTVTNDEGKYLDADGNVSEDEQILTLADFEYDQNTKIWTKTFEEIPVGSYTVTETNSEIEGYTFVADLSTTEGTAEITENAEETVEIKNVYESTDVPADTYRVHFKKIELPAFDADGSIVPVEGSNYGIFAATEADMTKPIGEVILDPSNALERETTDADGDVTFTVDRPGYYFLKELIAPDGYALSPTPVLIKVNGDNDYEIINGGEDRGDIAQVITVLDDEGKETEIVIWREDIINHSEPTPVEPVKPDEPDTPVTEPTIVTVPTAGRDDTYTPETQPVAPTLVSPIYGTTVTTEQPTTEDVGAGAGVADNGTKSDADRNTVTLVLIMCLAFVIASITGVKYIKDRNK
ncbi:MAG: hypothetical protein IJ251_08795, partial [Oscillospiraceae bacterium]|nr:hypothetical protein [Oscillospiraceae bacterium]